MQRRLQPVRKDFKGRPEVIEFLDALQADIVENFNLFMPADRGEPPAAGELPQPQRRRCRSTRSTCSCTGG